MKHIPIELKVIEVELPSDFFLSNLRTSLKTCRL